MKGKTYFYQFIFFAILSVFLGVIYLLKRLGYFQNNGIVMVFWGCLGSLVLTVVNAVGWKSQSKHNKEIRDYGKEKK